MTVPSTWPWKLVLIRPQMTSRYIIFRTLKNFWKFEKFVFFENSVFENLNCEKQNLNNFWENFRLIIFATSARIMIFITRRQKSDWTWIINWQNFIFWFCNFRILDFRIDPKWPHLTPFDLQMKFKFNTT